MLARLTFTAAVLVSATLAANMNGKYSVASGSHQGVPFNDDYASKGHEFFDVYAPEIATHYGEVFWTDQGNQPLPDYIVKRFSGKVMAITGYEQDQVMVQPTGQPGVNPGLDTSVPINWAYNHHYMAWMTGNYSFMQKILADPNDVAAHGSPMKWVMVDKESASFRADPSIPTSQMFSEGNGGESRKSFHGYPNGFAQLIESPTTWHITPMQIDTRNRDCGVTPADIKNCTRFIPGPEPRQARYGLGIPTGTNYSGILECPCNSRYGGDPVIYSEQTKTKSVTHKLQVQATAGCNAGEAVDTAELCFSAAATLGLNASKIVNSTVGDDKHPTGCSVSVSDVDGTATVYFNQAKSSDPCSVGSLMKGQATSPVDVTLSLSLDAKAGPTQFDRMAKGEYCSANHDNVLAKFVMTKAGDDAADMALEQCEQFCRTSAECTFCSVDCSLGSMTVCQWVALPTCGNLQTWAGLVQGDVSRKQSGVATITVSGPADVWFGVGFNAQQMADQPYTLIVNSSGVIEQQIGTCGSEAEHCPGTQLETSVKIVSNTVAGNVRTVVMVRPFQGLTKQHYTFDPATQATLPFITAVGSTPVFAYHKAHAPSVLSLTTPGDLTCVCDVGANGKLCDQNGTNCDTFVKNCVPSPTGDLLAQDNPTCNSRSYSGGLRCCGHKRIMLDVDQPVRPELLRYHMKFRFWFQEYAVKNNTPSHHNLPRIYQQTEANAGEYDIPPAFATPGHPVVGYPSWPENKPTPGTTCTGDCPNGKDCSCYHTIEYLWNTGNDNMRLIYAGGHCHAPSCIKMELFRNDTGALLCRQLPIFGQGNVEHDKFDEAGYLAIPPCLWGDDQGLEKSQLLPPNTPLLMVKHNWNTHMGHFGEMASWQMRGVNF